jgi:hypothetical protein
VGAKLEPGSGVAAAQSYWRSNPPARAANGAADRKAGIAA